MAVASTGARSSAEALKSPTKTAKWKSRLGLDRATLTLGHETFFGVASKIGVFSGVYARQRVNFSGANSGRASTSVAADLAFNLQAWCLPGGGFGYLYGTDHQLDGPMVDVHWGPFVVLHHPDYGNCGGVFLPGIGGLLAGPEIVAFGAAVPVLGPTVREGAYFFLRHPAIAYVTHPALRLAHGVAGIPLIDRRVVKPVMKGAHVFTTTLEPLRAREEVVFKRCAERLSQAVDRVRGGNAPAAHLSGSRALRWGRNVSDDRPRGAPVQLDPGRVAPRSSAR